jgi:hypothetical protein
VSIFFRKCPTGCRTSLFSLLRLMICQILWDILSFFITNIPFQWQGSSFPIQHSLLMGDSNESGAQRPIFEESLCI